MPTPILATKLYLPPPGAKIVLRSRLTERLNEGLHRKLTLISAPAGFGKTTLLSDWLAGYERPAAWLSLDEGDSDPARFLSYLVAALQTIAPNIAEGVLGALQSPQPPPTESILTALLNEITTIPDQIVLVLDDYHAVDARAVDDALTFLLEHLPPRMHLIIATREDPQLPLARLRAQRQPAREARPFLLQTLPPRMPLIIATREDPQLPLARLRARGQLSELRAADLRFTPPPARGFLEAGAGHSRSAAD